jgi:hypothetical protein
VSTDNGLIIRKRGGEFLVCEYDASSGNERILEVAPSLHDATLYADRYMRSTVVEYGVSFDFDDPDDLTEVP